MARYPRADNSRRRGKGVYDNKSTLLGRRQLNEMWSCCFAHRAGLGVAVSGSAVSEAVKKSWD